MQTRLGLVLGLLLLGLSTAAFAQQNPCRHVKATPRNTGTCIAVSTVPIIVATNNVGRCSMILINNSGNPMRCTDFDIDGDPTGTKGIPIGAGVAATFGTEGQGTWKCIRDTTATGDASACLGEGLP
jgi:hypothetical protein